MRKPKAKLLFQVHPYLNSSGKGREIVEFAKNHKLFSQGDPCKSVFYLREGAVKLTVINESGKEAVIAMLGEGDFFGEGCLAGQPLRMSTVTTISECSIEAAGGLSPMGCARSRHHDLRRSPSRRRVAEEEAFSVSCAR